MLAPAFYARSDVATPVRIAIAVLVASQALNLVLVPWLGHAGLALSIGIGALFNAALLLAGLLRGGVYRPQPGWPSFLIKVLLANAALGGLLWWAGQGIDWIGLRTDWAQRAGAVAAVLAGTAILYLALLALLGLRPRQFARSG